MHHFEQYPPRMTLEMIKVPAAWRRDGTKGEGNSSPNPENRMNFPLCSLRKIDSVLSQTRFFPLFSWGKAGAIKREMPSGCQNAKDRIHHAPGTWMKCWRLQTDTYNSSTAATVWNPGTTAESPRVTGATTLCHPDCQSPAEELGCTLLLDPKGRRT